MIPVYKQITPDQVWVSYLPGKENESEGCVVNEYGNRPSGNDFVDLFAGMVKKHGWNDAIFYARLLHISPIAFGYTIQTLTGITAKEWISQFVVWAARELLAGTDMTISEVATKLGFTQLCPFSNLFLRYEKVRPREWRWANKK